MAVLVINTALSAFTILAIWFVLMAYLLHPSFRLALKRIRAYSAWRAIEQKKTVEITRYPLFVEILRCRDGGGCNFARITAVLFAVFILACCGSLFCMDLAHVSRGRVDLMDRPPPVLLRDDVAMGKVAGDDDGVSGGGMGASWEVMPPRPSSERLLRFPNLKGSMAEGNATAVYRVSNRMVAGSILSAWWSTDTQSSPIDLYYASSTDGDLPQLVSLSCTTLSNSGLVYIGENTTDSWGKYFECVSGPEMASLRASSSPATTIEVSSSRRPPSVVMIQKSDESAVHLVVEERGCNYPTFLYSVWTAESPMGVEDVQIRHMFYIASQSRLAEAIITALVHGMTSGGQCVYLREDFSRRNRFYLYPTAGRYRAAPLGEQPGNSTMIKDLSKIERVEAGVGIGSLGSAALLWLLLVSFLGIGCAGVLHSRIGVDVYDRDELIRAVCLQAQPAAAESHGDGVSVTGRSAPVSVISAAPLQPSTLKDHDPQMMSRMYVRKDEASGSLTVLVGSSEEGDDTPHGWWDMLCCRSRPSKAKAKMDAGNVERASRNFSNLASESGDDSDAAHKFPRHAVVKLSCERVQRTCRPPPRRGYGPTLAQAPTNRLKKSGRSPSSSQANSSNTVGTGGRGATEASPARANSGVCSSSGSPAAVSRQAWPVPCSTNDEMMRKTGRQTPPLGRPQLPSAAMPPVPPPDQETRSRSSPARSPSGPDQVTSVSGSSERESRSRPVARATQGAVQVAPIFRSLPGILAKDPHSMAGGLGSKREKDPRQGFESSGGGERGSVAASAAVVRRWNNGSRSYDSLVAGAIARGQGEQRYGAEPRMDDESTRRHWTHSHSLMSLPASDVVHVPPDLPYARLSSSMDNLPVAGTANNRANNGANNGGENGSTGRPPQIMNRFNSGSRSHDSLVSRDGSRAPEATTVPSVSEVTKDVDVYDTHSGRLGPQAVACVSEAESLRMIEQQRGATARSGSGGNGSRAKVWSLPQRTAAVRDRHTSALGSFSSAPGQRSSAPETFSSAPGRGSSQTEEVTVVVKRASKEVPAAATENDAPGDRRSSSQGKSEGTDSREKRAQSLYASAPGRGSQTEEQIVVVKRRNKGVQGGSGRRRKAGGGNSLELRRRSVSLPDAPSYAEALATTENKTKKAAVPSYAEVVFATMPPGAQSTFFVATPDEDAPEEDAKNTFDSNRGSGTERGNRTSQSGSSQGVDAVLSDNIVNTAAAAAAMDAGIDVAPAAADPLGERDAAAAIDFQEVPTHAVSSWSSGRHSLEVSTNSSAPTTPQSSLKSPINTWLGPALVSGLKGGGVSKRAVTATGRTGFGNASSATTFAAVGRGVLPTTPVDSLVLSAREFGKRAANAGTTVLSSEEGCDVSAASVSAASVSAASGRGLMDLRGHMLFDAVSIATSTTTGSQRLASIVETDGGQFDLTDVDLHATSTLKQEHETQFE